MTLSKHTTLEQSSGRGFKMGDICIFIISDHVYFRFSVLIRSQDFKPDCGANSLCKKVLGSMLYMIVSKACHRIVAVVIIGLHPNVDT